MRIPLALLVVVAGCASTAPREAGLPTTAASPVAVARAGWLRDIDTLRAALARLHAATARGEAGARLRPRFVAARHAFKRVEFVAAYWEPSTTDLMNGPALPRVDDDEGPEAVFPPEGFQVLEEALFAADEPEDRVAALAEIANLSELALRLRTASAAQRVTPDRVWDAATLELARIASLGISGFDSPVALGSLPEAVAALDGMRRALGAWDAPLRLADPAAAAALAAAFVRADSLLRAAPSFDAFDRFGFVATGVRPLGLAMRRSREALGIGVVAERRPFRPGAATLFEADAFDPDAFAPPGTPPVTPARLALGRALFHDPRLSGDGRRACADCHRPDRGYADGLPRAAGRDPRAPLRNTPTILNAGLQAGSFADLRTAYLEDQVTDVVTSAAEMHGTLDGAAGRLAADPVMRAAFTGAFGAGPTAARLRQAVADYVRRSGGLASRVDRALRGDPAAISTEERDGFNLFMGKAKCGTCHFAPLFNGTVPPIHQETEVEVLGVPAHARTRGARIDADPGRFRLTRAAPHRFAFRTPTVRNVALTAPYMHNGVYRTLDEVVDFYDRGGGAGIGIALPNQTLPADRLGLTAGEKRALVAFMRALTDTAGLAQPATSAFRTAGATTVP